MTPDSPLYWRCLNRPYFLTICVRHNSWVNMVAVMMTLTQCILMLMYGVSS